MSADTATLIVLYGTAAPVAEPRILRAGALSARLEAGNLRYLTWGATEILRAVSFVVRDRDWGTYAPEIGDLAIDETPDGFSVRYQAVCRGTTVLRYRARIDGRADGSLVFAAEAVPEGDFETNRCGFVVLHPAAAAGAAATVEHVDGTREDTAFPELIDPWRPFVSIRAITHRVDGLTVTCRLAGESFEMEDQRNWSDASFKTYGRPLDLPWPFLLPAGVPVVQSVAVSVAGMPSPVVATGAVRVEIGPHTGARFPEIGLVVTAAEVPAALALIDRLADVAPQRILCAFDPTAGDRPDAFAAFARLRAAYPARYDLECVLDGKNDPAEELAAVAAAIAAGAMAFDTVAVSPAVDRQSTPPGSAWPACPPLEAVYAAARAAFPGLALGGGMFSYFTELNRKRPPVALLDFVTHATNPIVHAADDDSVMETLGTLPAITRSARAIIGRRPYRIGPSTIAMRQNPYGSRTSPNPNGERVTMADDDPRQRGQFAAAWTAGYAAAIAPADLAVWVPAAFTGPRGLVGPDGALLPVGETVRSLARLAGGAVRTASPQLARRLAVLAVDPEAGRTEVLTANLAASPLAVRLGPGAPSELPPLAVRQVRNLATAERR